MLTFIQKELQKSAALLQELQSDYLLHDSVQNIAKSCVKSLQQGGKILFAGNGGSAADAQHLAAELVGRLTYNRPSLAGLALTTDTSAITAIGNDYSFENLFSRQIEGLGQAGDVFVGITTSGKSPNIIKALEAAKQKGLVTVGFTGKTAPLMQPLCDFLLTIPTTETSKIQECHILFGHIICGLIQEEIFGAQFNPTKREEKAFV